MLIRVHKSRLRSDCGKSSAAIVHGAHAEFKHSNLQTIQKTRRPELRTRIISLISGDLLVNVLPEEVDLEKVVYKQEKSSVRVTDGSDWHMDISDLAWR
jgi:hypothetical protein